MNNDPFYLVWNTARGVPTKMHKQRVDAEAEAKRLAEKHPGDVFYICATMGYAQAPRPVAKLVSTEPESSPTSATARGVVGDGYRLLHATEDLQPGDEYHDADVGSWVKSTRPGNCGQGIKAGSMFTYRRRIGAHGA